MPLLCHSGVELSTPDAKGVTPADLARQTNHTDCAIFVALKSNDIHALLRTGNS